MINKKIPLYIGGKNGSIILFIHGAGD